jgi:hypothetical protein
MKDPAADLFDDEIRRKQKERSALRSKTGSKGSSRSRKGVNTPYDYMTTREKRKLSSEVSVKNLFDLLLSKEEFDQYPKEKQREILSHWRDIYPNGKIMTALEIKSQGTFNQLLERLDVPKKRSWSRSKQPKEKKKVDESESSRKEKEMDLVPLTAPAPLILDGLDLKYNGVYQSEDLSRILTKLQLLIEGENNSFVVSIKVQEKK